MKHKQVIRQDLFFNIVCIKTKMLFIWQMIKCAKKSYKSAKKNNNFNSLNQPKWIRLFYWVVLEGFYL